jgi:hypothetical protein
MQRTIQREKAWPARISPYSTSLSAGDDPIARWAEETIGARAAAP